MPTSDWFQAITDYGLALVALVVVVLFTTYVLRRYEARLISEADFLRTANGVFAAAIDRLTDEVKALRDERKGR